MDGQCHKMLRENIFKRTEETSQSNEDFIKSYNEETNEGYLLEVGGQDLKNLHNLHNDQFFSSEKMETENLKNV